MPRRVYKTRAFTRSLRRGGVRDAEFLQAVVEMEKGLIDADLGGGLLKKRVAVPGRGKSGGARTIVATNRGGKWFFLYGFLKNERANITASEHEALSEIAGDLMARSNADLALMVSSGLLEEIKDDEEA